MYFLSCPSISIIFIILSFFEWRHVFFIFWVFHMYILKSLFVFTSSVVSSYVFFFSSWNYSLVFFISLLVVNVLMICICFSLLWWVGGCRGFFCRLWRGCWESWILLSSPSVFLPITCLPARNNVMSCLQRIVSFMPLTAVTYLCHLSHFHLQLSTGLYLFLFFCIISSFPPH